MGVRHPIFISYAREDRHYLDKLLTHLQPLRMQNQVCAWSDTELQPGSDWRAEIEDSMITSKVFILLISKHYLASDFIRRSELPSLLVKEEFSSRPIVPVLLSPCLYELASFRYPDPDIGPGKFDLTAMQFFNDPSKPLSMLTEHDQDILFVSLAKRIYEITHAQTGQPPVK